MAKFNMTQEGHNIDTALVMLRNRAWDAEEAGDIEAAQRIWARHEKVQDAAYFMNGIIEVTQEQLGTLVAASAWAASARAERCAMAGVYCGEW